MERIVVMSREERHMSAIIEREETSTGTWYVLTTRGKGGAWVHPRTKTQEEAVRRMRAWFDAKG